MPPPSQKILQWLHNILTAEYRSVDRTYADVAQAITNHPWISLRTEIYTYQDGAAMLLLNLRGLLPVSFRGNSYAFPMSIWIPRDYPFTVPMSFVVPAGDMVTRPGQFVSSEGRVYHPYIAGWTVDRSSISELINICADIFSKEPPVVARPRQNIHQIQSAPNNQRAPALPPLPPAIAATRNRPAQSPMVDEKGPPPLPAKPVGRNLSMRDPSLGPPLPPLPPAPPDHPQRDQSSAHSQAQPNYYPTNHNNGQIQRTPPAAQSRAWPPSTSQQVQSNTVRPASDTSNQYTSFGPAQSKPTQWTPPNQVYSGASQRPHQSQENGAERASSRTAYMSNAPQWTPNRAQIPPQQRQMPPDPKLRPGLPMSPPQNRRPPEDLLTSPFDATLPVARNDIAPPPIPPNPQKDALLSTISNTLGEQIRSNYNSTMSAIAPLQTQENALKNTIAALSKEMAELNNLETLLSSNEAILHQAMRDSDKVLEDAKRRKVPNVDEVLIAPSIVSRQLYEAVAEERALEDSRNALAKALDKGRISGNIWAKQTRSLAREEFLKKATIKKISRGLGLVESESFE